MSGGKDRKLKSSKAQGWEEAGGEFYQESYPGDLESMQKDPAAIATLLPSKQNRVATTRRVRGNQDTKGTRRRPGQQSNQNATSTSRNRRASTTVQRGAQYHDVQVAMLPDLSQDLTDEERIWEEIHEIKSMPVSMAQKREMKAQLQNATKLRLQGLDQIKWQRRKAWQRFEVKWSEFLTKMEPWRHSLKCIEGNFGTGIVAYFLFLRWLMFLNLAIFLLIFTFIVLPHITIKEPIDLPCHQTEINSTQCCSESYMNSTTNEFSVLDIIQGTGFMEKTLMFYGMYTNKIFGYHPYESETYKQIDSPGSSVKQLADIRIDQLIIDKETENENILFDDTSVLNLNSSHITTFEPTTEEAITTSQRTLSGIILDKNIFIYNSTGLYYDLPLAYVSITAICFLISLAAIVKAASREFKDRLVDGEGQFYQYCNLVFGGWDFCIHNEKSADIKHKALYNEVKGLLHTKRMEFERHNRSRDFMCKLILIRIFINIFVIIILAAAALLIYYLFNVSLKYLEVNYQESETLYHSSNNNYSRSDLFISSSSLSSSSSEEDSMKFSEKGYIIEYQVQMEILFFEFLPYVAIVCLNLLVPILFNYLCEFEQYSPMFVIKISLFRTVFLRLSSLAVLLSRFYFLIIPKSSENKCSSKLQCWETFIGQQFYKLVITDFVTHVFVTFFVNFPRSLIAKHINSRFARFFGEQEFELSKHVLDVVYSQTLCWLGAFFAPFLPAISTILTFLMFYIKKFQCLVNSKPSGILYRASKSNSLFMFILLLSYVIAVVPIVYSIAEITPSRACGPFRGLHSVWDAAILAFMKMPSLFQQFIFFLGTAGFAIPCFIILTLFLYYYYALSDANKHMVEVLKNQLVLEGHDKQFLLNRLSSFIKQQQEYQKKNRQSEKGDGDFQQPQIPPRNERCEQPQLPPRDHKNSRDRNKMESIDV